MKKHHCKCGETMPVRFSGNDKSRCTACRDNYNVEYYKRKRKEAARERKQRKQHAISCADAISMTVSDPGCFQRFCQRRREIKRWSSDRGSYCKDCQLHDRVDNGFIPGNIKIMHISLMAAIN